MIELMKTLKDESMICIKDFPNCLKRNSALLLTSIFIALSFLVLEEQASTIDSLTKENLLLHKTIENNRK